ncbi:hypothetical protein C2845_PM06G00180 [Panicum miliaceum]|uniref:Uncharacterized protein n=1 Tax=Panicum miliaceum TaxID=4540 RepID=A0A3L6R8Y4_PANMI|nr:hypothetical protein C2845_PM06G00180 [Panicum miliaceum]
MAKEMARLWRYRLPRDDAAVPERRGADVPEAGAHLGLHVRQVQVDGEAAGAGGVEDRR